MTPTNAQRYEAQTQSMLAAAKQWRAEHPDSNPIIQWNFPSNVAVIGTISDGIEHHFVNTNEDGLSLIKALWPWDCDTETHITNGKNRPRKLQ